MEKHFMFYFLSIRLTLPYLQGRASSAFDDLFFPSCSVPHKYWEVFLHTTKIVTELVRIRPCWSATCFETMIKCLFDIRREKKKKEKSSTQRLIQNRIGSQASLLKLISLLHSEVSTNHPRYCFGIGINPILPSLYDYYCKFLMQKRTMFYLMTCP